MVTDSRTGDAPVLSELLDQATVDEPLLTVGGDALTISSSAIRRLQHEGRNSCYSDTPQWQATERKDCWGKGL